MSLIEAIRADIQIARLARNQKVITILSTLLGDAERIGKNKRNGESTDEEVVPVVKKFIEGNDENIRIYSFIDENSDKVQELRFQNQIYAKYMPIQLTTEEVQVLIKEIISSKNLNSISQAGLVMGELKKNFSGKYDGAVAMQLVRESLV